MAALLRSRRDDARHLSRGARYDIVFEAMDTSQMLPP